MKGIYWHDSHVKSVCTLSELGPLENVWDFCVNGRNASKLLPLRIQKIVKWGSHKNPLSITLNVGQYLFVCLIVHFHIYNNI